MLLAELDGQAWVLIIGAIGAVLFKLYEMRLASVRSQKQKEAIADVAKRVEKATNGIVQARVDQATLNGELQGGKDERARADQAAIEAKEREKDRG
jgi:hypothetical protein